MKRQETIDIENKLVNAVADIGRNASFGFYGCEEVTIGFANAGRGNEIVDFMTMTSTGIIRCYEIKVTLADLKSKAKLSWYGHYNYLVIGGELMNNIELVKSYIPKEIGILDHNLRSIRRTKLQEVPDDVSIMLKESLIRSMYHKMNKYKNSQDIEKYKKINSKLNFANKELNGFRKSLHDLTNNIYKYELYLKHTKNIDFCLDDELYSMHQFYKNKNGDE